MKTTIKPVNLTRMVTKMELMAAGLPKVNGHTTRRVARKILRDTDTKEPLVPVKSGDLRSTGRIERMESGRRTLVGHEVKFGGPAASGKIVDYAEKVHENFYAKKWTRPGSGPKFLETHVNRRLDEMGVDLDSDLRAEILRVFGR